MTNYTNIIRNLSVLLWLSLTPIIGLAWGLEVPLSVISKNKGKVLVITNTSDEYLHECSISINPPNDNPFVIPTIGPHASNDIGWLELGFELRPTDQVSILCKKYAIPFTLKIK